MLSIIREIVQRRSLIRQFVLRDLKVRYSRPALGFLWAFLSPFFMAVIFYSVFSFVLKVKINEAPFFLYLLSGIFTWSFFQDSLTYSSYSLMNSKHLIRESNFPHYLIPLSIVLANGINFLPILVILVIASLCSLKALPIFILFLPAVLVVHIAITAGLSIIFSILYVRWRDIRYILDALLLLLLYATPVVYSFYSVKGAFPYFLFKLYMWNPFVGILNCYRVTLLSGYYGYVQKDAGFLSLVVAPLVFAAIVLFSAFKFYKKYRGKINDYLSY
jgi:ABC-type polysaccharide/polyol phosphate export permease